MEVQVEVAAIQVVMEVQEILLQFHQVKVLMVVQAHQLVMTEQAVVVELLRLQTLLII